MNDKQWYEVERTQIVRIHTDTPERALALASLAVEGDRAVQRPAGTADKPKTTSMQIKKVNAEHE